MPPETTSAAPGETPATPAPTVPTPAPAASPTPDGSQAEPFDQERAMRTIAQLREFEKQAKAQAKELETLRKAQQARDDAELSEKDRATKRTAELEAELTRERAERRQERLALAVEREARALKFRNPLHAVRLLDPDAIELSDDGAPKNLPALLKALATADAYLVEPEEPAAPQGPVPIGATPRPSNGRAQSETERAQYEQSIAQSVRRHWS